MGNIAKKILDNRESRRAAYDSKLGNKKGYRRPGSMKKKTKSQPGETRR